GVVSNNVVEDPHFLAHPLLPDTESEMAIPMLVGNRVIGVLDVQSTIIGRFTDEDVQIKTILAEQIAVAVQNAQTFTQVQEANAERQRLYNSSIDLIGSAGMDGYFKGLNPAWSKITGYTHEELTSRPFLEFVHPDDVER